MVTDQMLDLFNVDMIDMYKKNNEVEEEGKSNAEDSEKSKKMESLLILILTKPVQSRQRRTMLKLSM